MRESPAPSWRPAYLGVAALLLVQIFLVRWIAGEEQPPAAPDLTHIAVPQWQAVRDEAMDPAVIRELRADRWMSKSYMQLSGSLLTNLLVAWFESQRGGASQPHSPQVCLPGSGWTPREIGEVTLETVAGPIRVNRYNVGKGDQRAVVLYWYQTSRRAVASEWASKFWTIADSLQLRRTDVALVRVIVYDAPGQEPLSSALASGFARALYPVMRETLSGKVPVTAR